MVHFQFTGGQEKRTTGDAWLLTKISRQLMVVWAGSLFGLAVVIISVALLTNGAIDGETRARTIGFELAAVLVTVPLLLWLGWHVISRELEEVSLQLTLRKKSTEDAAHELATPVSILKSRLQVMERLIADDNVVKENISELADATNRLVILIESIRALARAENCEFYAELSIIKLDRVVNAAIATMKEEADRANISVKLDAIDSIAIVADAEGIERIIANLLSNAIKYSTAGGAVTISLTQDKDLVKLSVADDGCGIPEESLPHIFDRFYRVDKSRSRDAGGSGLGLSITKAIVEAHGGCIDVVSQEAKGTKFSVSLPRYPKSHPMALLHKKK
jgi:two-component system, OmpR family, sensor histidine kinase BaeS